MSKKLSKSLLKEIVKECLVELLFEGIGEDDSLLEAASVPKRKKQSLYEAVEERTQEIPRSERKLQGTRRSTPTKSSVVSQVENSISSLTNDPVMAEIFADTARTTLVEQLQGEGRHAPTTMEAATVASTDNIEDLFSGAGDWAAIAFAGQKDLDT